MLRIAIDGACRRNGKPDCVSSGGVFVQQLSDDGVVVFAEARSNFEYESTNQRGELLALLTALDYVYSARQDAQIITDSEYLFNAMTNEWYVKWVHNNWKTSLGEPVKNADLWREIVHAMNKCVTEINFYHIKGHVIPFGKVTAEKLLLIDPSGMLLYSEAAKKFDSLVPTKKEAIEHAQELSVKNNRFRLDDETLKRFVVSNVVVDAIATKVVDTADKALSGS